MTQTMLWSSFRAVETKATSERLKKRKPQSPSPEPWSSRKDLRTPRPPLGAITSQSPRAKKRQHGGSIRDQMRVSKRARSTSSQLQPSKRRRTERQTADHGLSRSPMSPVCLQEVVQDPVDHVEPRLQLQLSPPVVDQLGSLGHHVAQTPTSSTRTPEPVLDLGLPPFSDFLNNSEGRTPESQIRDILRDVSGQDPSSWLDLTPPQLPRSISETPQSNSGLTPTDREHLQDLLRQLHAQMSPFTMSSELYSSVVSALQLQKWITCRLQQFSRPPPSSRRRRPRPHSQRDHGARLAARTSRLCSNNSRRTRKPLVAAAPSPASRAWWPPARLEAPRRRRCSRPRRC